MTRPLVALGTRLRPAVVAALAERYTVVETDGPLEAVRVSKPARMASALVTLGILPTAGDLMDAMPELGLIACYGTGYDGIDLEAARARGIAVTHSPGGNASSVADLAMALLLASTRRIVASHLFVTSGSWSRHPAPDIELAPGLYGAHLGIYGLGTIGRLVAERAAVFGLEVGYHGRRRQVGEPRRFFPTLVSLAGWADILLVTARASSENRGAVDRAVLKALGPAGHLVNVARGSLVDEPALVDALRSRTIAGAALDVYSAEPMSSGPLLAAPNVVLSPHLGGATVVAQSLAVQMVLDNLSAYFEGRPLPNAVIDPRPSRE